MVRGLCKIGIFGVSCTEQASTIVEDPWNSGETLTFDLLKDTSKQIILPTMTITPDPCYMTSWSVFDSSTNQDVISLSVFAISASNLVISHTIMRFDKRF